MITPTSPGTLRGGDSRPLGEGTFKVLVISFVLIVPVFEVKSAKFYIRTCKLQNSILSVLGNSDEGCGN